ncbi:MAG TPA: hybrid sensor histidine kinase/response regulator, partial [Telmatospirillum sp.]|nr:hybrid sensor histidine kinase/response regulator [Telmatospirillum sp.]
TSSDAVAILSCEGETIYVNPSHQKLFGRAPDGKEWRGYLDLHTEEGRHVVRHFVLPSLEQGREWDGVLDAKDAEGQVFPLWQRALVWRDQTGQPRYYFVFMRDHRGQQRLREELRKAKELTEQANVAKSRFLAAASHDLRQPLQALSMFVAVLSNRSHAPEDRQLIKRIDDSVCAVETLLNGLLDVSKLEAGLVIPALASFDMAPLLTRLATEFQPMAAEAGLSFRWVPSHSLVRSDPVLLERILRNLLNNALRYTKTGAILLGCRHRKGRLFIEVWDTGIGIPRNHLKLIFREFHQLGNSARDRRQGLGLGLAIVDRLARLLGHEVNVVSELQKGSMFSIELPVAKVTATTVQPKQLPLGIRNGCSTILIIEDEPDVLESIHLLLESWGFYALSSRSCDEALLALSKEGRLPDLILADYRLQGGATGAHAINRIRSCLKSLLPAIILTGDTAPERLRQAKASGYNVLHKPVQPVVLRRMIDEVLARSPSVRSSGA